MVFTPPRTHFQTRGTDSGTGLDACMVDATLAAGLLALPVASLVLGVARAPTKVLTVQHTLARVLGMVHARDYSRRNLVDVQIPLLALPAPSIALL